MIRQTSRHPRCSCLPLGLNQPRPRWSGVLKWQPQTVMRPGEVVQGVEEDDPPTQLLPVFARAPTLALKRRQGVTQGQVQALNQTGADLQPEFSQARGTAADRRRERFEVALFFLLDQLSVDPFGMRLQHGLARAARFAGPRKFLESMVDRDQCGQITTQALAEKTRDPEHDRRGQLNQGQGARRRGPTSAASRRRHCGA